MHEEIMVAGSGGQGVLLIGELLAQAAMEEGKYVTWFPSYGPAMRGGKANCTVIISSKEIGSPISDQLDSLIVMNQPSLEFVRNVKPNGLVVLNKSLVGWDSHDLFFKVTEIKATDFAQEIGVVQATNIVMLGAFLKNSNCVSLETVAEVLRKKLIEKKIDSDIVNKNLDALLAEHS